VHATPITFCHKCPQPLIRDRWDRQLGWILHKSTKKPFSHKLHYYSVNNTVKIFWLFFIFKGAPYKFSWVIITNLLPGFSQLDKKLSSFYGTRRFITICIHERPHLHLSWVRWIPYTPSNSVSLKYILVSFFHLHLSLPTCPLEFSELHHPCSSRFSHVCHITHPFSSSLIWSP
jgi:hypothetical protein